MFKPTYNKEKKIWSGAKVSPMFNPNQNIGQLIVRVLEQTPLAITQISSDTGVEITCDEMRSRILKMAAYYTEMGLKKGDIVAVLAQNTENLAPAVYGCLLVGLSVLPISPLMAENDIIKACTKFSSKLIICDGENLKMVQSAVDNMKSEAKILNVMEDVEGHNSVTKILKSKSTLKSFNLLECSKSDTTAFIVRSSGTTGPPKNVLKSHRELLNTKTTILWDYNSDSNNVLLQYTTIYWFTQLYFFLVAPLFKCTRIITTQALTPLSVADTINKYKVTIIATLPYFVFSILQLENLKPFESIKQWGLGGQPVSKVLCDSFKKFVPNGTISAVYACTEMGCIAVDKSALKYGSCGYPFENVQIKIVDDNGNVLENNEKGEIYVKTISEFREYYNDPDETAKTFDDGWYKTGDYGYFDDDGFIYVIDRKKELLRLTNRKQMIPSEMEIIINEIKGVMNSCVIGVISDIGVDIIHAFVIIDKTSGLTEDYIKNYVNDRVIEEKQIRGGVHFVDSFLLGLTGKVDRMKMKNLAKDILNR